MAASRSTTPKNADIFGKELGLSGESVYRTSERASERASESVIVNG